MLPVVSRCQWNYLQCMPILAAFVLSKLIALALQLILRWGWWDGGDHVNIAIETARLVGIPAVGKMYPHPQPKSCRTEGDI
eukprot:1918039-Amphidinium_carterae.1